MVVAEWPKQLTRRPTDNQQRRGHRSDSHFHSARGGRRCRRRRISPLKLPLTSTRIVTDARDHRLRPWWYPRHRTAGSQRAMSADRRIRTVISAGCTGTRYAQHHGNLRIEEAHGRSEPRTDRNEIHPLPCQNP